MCTSSRDLNQAGKRHTLACGDPTRWIIVGISSLKQNASRAILTAYTLQGVICVDLKENDEWSPQGRNDANLIASNDGPGSVCNLVLAYQKRAPLTF